MGIQVNHLVKSFGATRVVNDVTFTVNPGELVALLGPMPIR
jgi:ABC-type multidrug transport system ATPase subunit